MECDSDIGMWNNRMKCCLLTMSSSLLPPHHQPYCVSSPMATSLQCPQRANEPIGDSTIKRSVPHRGACSAPQLLSNLILPILATLHGSVNWHLHCGCKVFRLVLEMYPHMGCIPLGFCKTRTLGHGYGFSVIWVRVALENPRVTHANLYGQPMYWIPLDWVQNNTSWQSLYFMTGWTGMHSWKPDFLDMQRGVSWICASDLWFRVTNPHRTWKRRMSVAYQDVQAQEPSRRRCHVHIQVGTSLSAHLRRVQGRSRHGQQNRRLFPQIMPTEETVCLRKLANWLNCRYDFTYHTPMKTRTFSCENVALKRVARSAVWVAYSL